MRVIEWFIQSPQPFRRRMNEWVLLLFSITLDYGAVFFTLWQFDCYFKASASLRDNVVPSQFTDSLSHTLLISACNPVHITATHFLSLEASRSKETRFTRSNRGLFSFRFKLDRSSSPWNFWLFSVCFLCTESLLKAGSFLKGMDGGGSFLIPSRSLAL